MVGLIDLPNELLLEILQTLQDLSDIVAFLESTQGCPRVAEVIAEVLKNGITMTSVDLEKNNCHKLATHLGTRAADTSIPVTLELEGGEHHHIEACNSKVNHAQRCFAKTILDLKKHLPKIVLSSMALKRSDLERIHCGHLKDILLIREIECGEVIIDLEEATIDDKWLGRAVQVLQYHLPTAREFVLQDGAVGSGFILRDGSAGDLDVFAAPFPFGNGPEIQKLTIRYVDLPDPYAVAYLLAPFKKELRELRIPRLDIEWSSEDPITLKSCLLNSFSFSKGNYLLDAFDQP